MVALNESMSGSGPCRPARCYAVTASYPQGSTAIPACEMNYPGAAALTRHPASAKFCPVSGASGRLDINGANTYQFVMSNPITSTDASGRNMIMTVLPYPPQPWWPNNPPSAPWGSPPVLMPFTPPGGGMPGTNQGTSPTYKGALQILTQLWVVILGGNAGTGGENRLPGLTRKVVEKGNL